MLERAERIDISVEAFETVRRRARRTARGDANPSPLRKETKPDPGAVTIQPLGPVDALSEHRDLDLFGSGVRELDLDEHRLWRRLRDIENALG